MTRIIRQVGVVCAAAFVSACSKAPSDKDVVDSMVSWIATADMASQAWLNHTTFDRYTREILELSAHELGEQANQLRQIAPRRLSADSSGLGSAVTRARHSITMIAGLIAANDAPDVQTQLDSLRATKKIVLAASDAIAKKKQ